MTTTLEDLAAEQQQLHAKALKLGRRVATAGARPPVEQPTAVEGRERSDVAEQRAAHYSTLRRERAVDGPR